MTLFRFHSYHHGNSMNMGFINYFSSLKPQTEDICLVNSVQCSPQYWLNGTALPHKELFRLRGINLHTALAIQLDSISSLFPSLQLAGVPEITALATPNALELAFSTWTMPCNRPSFLLKLSSYLSFRIAYNLTLSSTVKPLMPHSMS